jgi:sugar/nucleoside kinase (ribokinase family)
MNQLKYILLAALCALVVSCGEKGKDDPTDSLTLNPTSLSFAAKGASAQSVTVTASGTWSATPKADWIQVSTASGSFSVTVSDNESEARAFTGSSDPRTALDALARISRTAIVKVGKAGSWLKRGEEVEFVEPWPADPVDATGAGDTYAAGFLYADAQGMPLKVCGEIGSIIAAKVVEVIGTKIDIPRWRIAKQEIRELTEALGA